MTQEIRLAGGGERLDWLFGSFYGSSERRYGQSAYAKDYVAADGPAVTDFLRAVTGIPDLVWSGSRPLAGHPDTEELFFSDLDYDFEQLAFFGEATVAVTDRLSLTGGLRWYDFDEERTQVFDGLFADPLDSTGTTSASGVAPRIIASYDVTDATQVNAQVSKGFRLGGINDPLNAPICSEADLATFGGRGTWEDEELWNYEAGVKSTFLGGRGTFNASGFYMDIRNLQATLTAGTCSSRIIFNVPDARSTGVELELAAQPTTFFDFAVSASVADARLQSTITSTDANRGRPAPADDAPLPGRDRGHVALAGRRRLGRLPQRDLPARRLDEAVRLDVPFPGREPAGRGPRPTLRSTPSSCAPADGGHR